LKGNYEDHNHQLDDVAVIFFAQSQEATAVDRLRDHVLEDDVLIQRDVLVSLGRRRK
jgi:hypothetical protein